jgi:hypothetical protein
MTADMFIVPPLASGVSHQWEPPIGRKMFACSESSWRAVQIIKSIERRLSYITFLPVENGEGLQILRYEARIVIYSSDAAYDLNRSRRQDKW